MPAGVEETPAEVASSEVDKEVANAGGTAAVVTHEKERVASAETEAFMAFLFTNWRKVADENSTDNCRKIFNATEKLFKSLTTQKPKKPCNAYVLFSQQVCKDIAIDLKDAEGSAKGVGKEISRRWNQLTLEERAPFVEDANQQKREYLGAMKKYQGD